MINMTLSALQLSDTSATSHLRQAYEAERALFDIQPTLTQRFFEAQGQLLAGAVIQNATGIRFTLPDQVVAEAAA